MTEKVVKERLKLFYDNKVKTYIKNIYGKFFNGNILEIKRDIVMFEDRVIGVIPIIIKEIEEIDYSKENPLKKWEERKNGV